MGKRKPINNGWDKHAKLVLSELERLNQNHYHLTTTVQNIRIDIAMLNVKAGMWGALGGILAAIGAGVVYLLSTR